MTLSGPPLAMEGVAAALVVLGAPEVGQHVVPAPAVVAFARPAVVVLGLAAHVDHGVDRARAAEHLAARLVAAPAAEAGLRHGLEGPVVGAVLGQQREPGGAVDEDALVGRPGLEQADADGRVLARGAPPARSRPSRRRRSRSRTRRARSLSWRASRRLCRRHARSRAGPRALEELLGNEPAEQHVVHAQPEARLGLDAEDDLLVVRRASAIAAATVFGSRRSR